MCKNQDAYLRLWRDNIHLQKTVWEMEEKHMNDHNKLIDEIERANKITVIITGCLFGCLGIIALQTI
jgi:hypothetical protein